MANLFWLKLNRRRAFIVAAKFLTTNSNVAMPTIPLNQFSHSLTSRAFFKRKSRPPTTPSAFSHFVSDIILISTEKQVLRVHAGWIITVMQNVQRLLKVTISKLITDTMCCGSLAFKPKLAIQLRLATASFTEPFPAFVGSFFVNLSPKAFNIRGVHRHRIACPRGVCK